MKYLLSYLQTVLFFRDCPISRPGLCLLKWFHELDSNVGMDGYDCVATISWRRLQEGNLLQVSSSSWPLLSFYFAPSPDSLLHSPLNLVTPPPPNQRGFGLVAIKLSTVALPVSNKEGFPDTRIKNRVYLYYEGLLPLGSPLFIVKISRLH